MVKTKSKTKKQVKIISVRKPMKKKAAKSSAKQNEVGTFMQLVSKIDVELGKYAFAIGVLAALMFAFINMNELPKEFGAFLIVVGVIIGLINITHKERNLFLIATIALIVTNGANIGSIGLWDVGRFLQAFIWNLTILFAPAAVIIALEAIYSLAKKR
ncbi:MAG: hypothetical protein U9R34_03645 [Nanoarchaeota archaeon]|nr:hypothetical protein [Nanoarchaeota archaeon]